MIPGKQRKRKTHFSYFPIDCRHHRKHSSVQVHSALSAADFAQCSTFATIIMTVSHIEVDRLEIERELYPEMFFQPLSFKQLLQCDARRIPAPSTQALNWAWVISLVHADPGNVTTVFPVRAYFRSVSRNKIFFWTQTHPYALLLQSWTHLEAVWNCSHVVQVCISPSETCQPQSSCII